ncbi:hypothetical protein, partial [Streptococcus pneumoniae]|uniref:hypothetical protein n=1 Tax=Streptococcus pneumoniae TaxID=1313 RepID=UPI001CD8C650
LRARWGVVVQFGDDFLVCILKKDIYNLDICVLFHMNLSNELFVAFHYRSYGTFFLHKIGSIISIVDLPTTNIIEPKNLDIMRFIVPKTVTSAFHYRTF